MRSVPIPPGRQPTEVFRVVPRSRPDLVRSFADVGRFHVLADPPTSYLSLRPHTAIFEASQGIREVTVERFRLLRVAVRLTEGINLCEEGERNVIGLAEEEILGPKILEDPTQQARLLVARAARAVGAQGLWYPSRMDRPEGVNLVLFLEHAPVGRLEHGAALEILDEDGDPRRSRLSVVLDEIRAARGPTWVETARRNAYRP